MLRYAKLCYDLLSRVMSYFASLCFCMPFFAMLCSAQLAMPLLCYNLLCYAWLCFAELYYAMLCYVHMSHRAISIEIYDIRSYESSSTCTWYTWLDQSSTSQATCLFNVPPPAKFLIFITTIAIIIHSALDTPQTRGECPGCFSVCCFYWRHPVVSSSLIIVSEPGRVPRT